MFNENFLNLKCLNKLECLPTLVWTHQASIVNFIYRTYFLFQQKSIIKTRSETINKTTFDKQVLFFKSDYNKKHLINGLGIDVSF